MIITVMGVEKIFPGEQLGDFSKIFLGGPKVVKFVFSHSKLMKQPFFWNFKIPKPPLLLHLPTPMLTVYKWIEFRNLKNKILIVSCKTRKTLGKCCLTVLSSGLNWLWQVKIVSMSASSLLASEEGWCKVTNIFVYVFFWCIKSAYKKET